jgi:hypothetical protein
MTRLHRYSIVPVLEASFCALRSLRTLRFAVRVLIFLARKMYRLCRYIFLGGEGGQKVELARTWERIERLHAQRFGRSQS